MQEKLDRLREIGAEIAALSKESLELRKAVYQEAKERKWKLPLNQKEPPFQFLAGRSRRGKIVIHPYNLPLLKRAINVRQIRDLPVSLWCALDGIPVYFDQRVPLRAVRLVWHAPPASRFVEYESSDEAWMRPLGLGTIEEVDNGPYIAWIDVEGISRVPHAGR